MERLEMSY